MRRFWSPVLLVLALTALACLPSAAAAQIHVPGDQPSLAAALATAGPGAVIVLSGGVHPPVVLTQPVTILGDPANLPRIRPSWPGEELVPALQDAAVTLAGPGTGAVHLSHIMLGGEVNGLWFSRAAPAVSGGGFGTLTLSECQAWGAEWQLSSGVGQAADGVQLDGGVGLLIVSDSTVRGGTGVGQPPAGLPLVVPNGGAGVRAPGWQVALLDSLVRGGDGLDVSVHPASGCPGSCNDVVGGTGGPGVVALAVYRAASNAHGGTGALVTCAPDGLPASVVCQPVDGADIAPPAALFELPAGYASEAAPVVGAPWSCTWAPSATRVLFLLSLQPGVPVSLGSRGVLFVDTSAFALLFLEGHGVTLQVPAEAELVGLSVVSQVYDPHNGLSRPQVQCVLPWPAGKL